MKLVKSLLLGTAAGLAAVSVASAADLPSRKAAPVEYVRVCSEYGKGFFYIPGSDTCILIGGRVRSDTEWVQSNNRNQDTFNFGLQARLHVDIRSRTPYGTVRAFTRYVASRGNKNWNADFGNKGTGSDNNAAAIDLAYIQFAGLTAGRVQSFFDFYANDKNFSTIRNSDLKTEALAYTATFGSGFSATLAIENGTNRRLNGNTFYGPGFDDNGYITDWGTAYSAGAVGYGGQSVPDVVGVLRVDQSWGSAQLAAAMHQIRPTASVNGNPYDNGTYGDTKYGWAVKGGVKLNLPMIAPGDELWLEAAYAQGALSYIGAPGSLNQGDIYLPVTDAFIGNNGNVRRAKGFSVMANFLHYWTPSIRQNLFGSYMRISNGRQGYGTTDEFASVGVGNFNYGFVDATEWKVGTNVIWSPIKNFDIGVEVLYSRLDPKGRVLSINNGRDYYNGKTISADDSWQGRLRIQRDF